MKYITIVCVISMMFTGCKTPEKILCTTWNIADVTFIGDVPEKERTETRNLFLAQKTITFNTDHTLQLGQQEQSGWRMSPKGDTLFLKNKDNESVTLIRKIDSKKVVLEDSGRKQIIHGSLKSC